MKNNKRMSDIETAIFCQQMELILASGLTPMAGIELMLEDAADAKTKAILKEISVKCNNGENFANVLQEAGIFPYYAMNMIKIGNTSGSLEEVMRGLAYHYNREHERSLTLKNALSYPLIVLSMMLAVVIILLTKVLPVFQRVYLQLGVELSGLSQTLLSVGNVLKQEAAYFLVALFFVVLLTCVLFFTTNGRKQLLKFLSSFFLTKQLFQQLSAGRFASGMSITLSAGLDPLESVELVAPLITATSMQSKVEKCKSLMEGKGAAIPLSFAQAVAQTQIFNNMSAKMISIGASTGSIDTVLRNIANQYDRDTDHSLNRILSVIEPTLVITLSIIVGMILLSVVLPLLGIMASIG